MKANRKYILEADEAVSAVIGVILMVAITVAIAATVYVYVTGMLGTGQTAAPTVTFTKATDRITVSRADPGLTWDDFEITYTGVTNVNLSAATTAWWASGTDGRAEDLDAGNYINATGAGSLSLRHVPTNSLIGTWTFT